MPMQQMLLGAGAVATKTYVDDIFATTLWEGNGNNSRTITTNIDTSTDGGLIWIKNRDNATYWNVLFDSVRGGSQLSSNRSDAALAQASNVAGYVSNYSTTGFTLTGGSGSNDSGNRNSDDNVAWSFKKTPGFFDIVTWTGNGSTNRQISHSLGSIPGCIMVKNISRSNEDWVVYHTRLNNGVDPEDYLIRLNQTLGQENRDYWSDTAPTSSVFTVDSAILVNQPSDNYVAYVFAGGESTAATARSVDFDGSNDYLEISSHADLQLGTGDFTLEMWWNGSPSGTYTQCFGTQSVFAAENGTWRVGTRFNSQNRVYFARGNGGSFDEFYYDVNVNDGQWHHIACVRASNIVTIYIDGIAQGTPDGKSSSVPANRSITGTCSSNEDFWVARQGRPSNVWAEGKMSNIRVVKGTAVYTSSFRPSTAPLANITNTVLLICNNSSVTGSTVTPGTISSGGSPTARTDSPFDDPAGFVFGENEDQNVIKCGSFIASAGSPYTVNVGFEPQWVLIRRTSSTGNWTIIDNMRGWAGDISSNETERILADLSNAAEGVADMSGLTSTGFTVDDGGITHGSNQTYIYMAIRRPDGYVGKLPKLGTGVFAMNTGTSNSDVPTFVSGFPVDFAFNRAFASSENWWTQSRLTGTKYLIANSTSTESTSSSNEWDFNNGWYGSTSNHSNQQSWMWKRHAGFDVVTYEGDGASSRQIPHNLSKIPEMMIVRGRGPDVANWYVYHKAMGNGRSINLETTDQQSGVSQARWDNTTPTSTHFSIGINPNTNNNDYLAILFASVQGISKVGSFSGVASASYPLSVTTGFAPRFILIKAYSGVSGYGWFVWDSLRYSGDDNLKLALNSTAAQDSGTTYQYFNDAPISTNSTGFSIVDDGWGSTDTIEFMYYAHA